MKQTISILLLTVFLGFSASDVAWADGNKKLMSINAAKADAKRGILESVMGLKVRSESVVRDMVAERFTIDAKTSGAVRDIEFIDMVYDPDKDVAKVVARIKVGHVKNIVGMNLNYPEAIIERIGFGTSSPENAPALQSMRAAQINAYQKLAEELVGLQIDSKTTVENYILQSDELKANVLAAIWGAEIKTFSWDASGDAYVTMSLRANYIKDMLGNRFVGEQPEIVVEGTGTSNDTFSSSSPHSGGETAIREESLGVPRSTDEKPKEGGATSP